MLYAHLILRKLLVFRHLWLRRSPTQTLPFLHNFATASSLPLEALQLYIAVNYYICNSEYTILGIGSLEFQFAFLLLSLPIHDIFPPSAEWKKNCCWLDAKFFFCFLPTRRICLDYWIAGASNMWWRHKRRVEGRKKVSQFGKLQMAFKRQQQFEINWLWWGATKLIPFMLYAAFFSSPLLISSPRSPSQLPKRQSFFIDFFWRNFFVFVQL